MKSSEPRRLLLGLLGVVCGLALAAGPASATVVVVDENGNASFGGTPLAFKLARDPGPGGLASVLTYTLPFANEVQGDVRMTDADVGGAFLDVVRFNGDGTLLFYSDNADGVDALGDTPSPPGSFYTNLVSIPEIGTEANNGAFYTPGPNDPGFALVGETRVTYQFISDATTVPEPKSLALIGLALGALWLTRRWRV